MNDKASSTATTASSSVATALLSGGFLVTFGSGLAYLAVYVYDFTYCSYFQIPVSLISIAVANLVAVAAIMAVFFYLLVNLMFFPIRSVQRLGSDWPALAFALFCMVGFADKVFTDHSLVMRRLDALAILGAFLAAIIFTVWRARRKDSEVQSSVLPPIIFLSVFMSERTAAGVIGVLFICGTVLATANLGGDIAARGEVHLVTNGPKPEVVLAIYGDIAVAAPYDPLSRTVSPTFAVYDVGKNLPAFTLEYTGILKQTHRPTSPLHRLKGQ